MLNGWRFCGLVAGTAAGSLLVVVGCTSVTGGKAVVDTKAAPAYRTSMSISVSESAATSSQRESQRQASVTTEAIHNSCDALSTSSVDAVRAVNAYVAARNAGGPDAAAKEGPAVDALNKGANLVSSTISATLSSQLRDGLTNWVNAARDVANAISTHASIDAFNAAIDKLNSARSTAISLCDAAY